jgi:hypothetical protein
MINQQEADNHLISEKIIHWFWITQDQK